MKKIIGSCSECGGDVVVEIAQHSIYPLPPQCVKCKAVLDRRPRLPMKPISTDYQKKPRQECWVAGPLPPGTQVTWPNMQRPPKSFPAECWVGDLDVLNFEITQSATDSINAYLTEQAIQAMNDYLDDLFLQMEPADSLSGWRN